ncbi:MAG TPA: aminotransferase class IV [Clostridiales bacterium]|nr:aminotransferase class IV [Clostridiales bacterium]
MHGGDLGRKVLLDRQIKFIDNIMIKPDSPALNYGCGLFETVLFDKGSIFFLKDHLKRLKNSCAELKLPVPESEWALEESIADLISQNGLTDKTARIKIMFAPLFEKTVWNMLVSAAEYNRDISPVRGSISQSIRDSAFYKHKTLSYMQNYLSIAGRNDEEILFANFQNNIIEGSRSNILCVKDNALYYCDQAENYLYGIMQKHIIADHKKLGFNNCETVKVGFSKEFLEDCTGAIMVNSLVIARDYSSLSLEKKEIKFIPSDTGERIRNFYLK